MSPNSEVTLRNEAGRKVGSIHIDALLADGLRLADEAIERTEYTTHFIVRFNKRGNIKHALRRQRCALVPLSNDGTEFQQELNSGRVWALRGVIGSERPKVAYA